MPRKGPDQRRKWHTKRRAKYATEQRHFVDSESIQHRIHLFLDDVNPLPIIALELKDFPAIISYAALEENVHIQVDIISLCLRRILYEINPECTREPRPEQVRCLRRLIFGKGDTLLIARTGFGKSLIFHAYSILTGKITIQIIPLSKLGDEQFEDLQKFSCARPCLLTSEGKRKEKAVFERIRAGEFTHILLGPEQASAPAFRNTLKEPRLQAMIGLVAIDECHLVQQWRDFRAAFTMLRELRTILRRDVVWFGCTATLDAESEQAVLQESGFRCLGSRPFQTEVIRTSIDRPDVSICVHPIPKGKVTSYGTLYFLLDLAACDGTATPECIAKTIIYVDSRKKIEDIALFLRSSLLAMSTNYTIEGDSPLAVSTVIETFTSHVSQYDRDKRYAEFRQLTSRTRIMVATTSLGMGVNIPDVERVVIWRFPIDAGLGDAWQRLGRGGRGEGRTSQAYIFLPYWAFDSEGCNRPVPSTSAQINLPTPRPTRKRNRNLLPSYRVRIPSKLSNSTTFAPEDNSDTESVASSTSESSQISQPQSQLLNESELLQSPVNSCELLRTPRPIKIKYWSKAEQQSRLQLSDCWKAICNSNCKRAVFLAYLGEGKLLDKEGIYHAPPERCCSGCNPDLLPVLTEPPLMVVPICQPRTGTKARIALVLLEKWATIQAEAEYTHPNRRFPIPASAYIGTETLWRLAYLFDSTLRTQQFWDELTLGSLQDLVPCLRD